MLNANISRIKLFTGEINNSLEDAKYLNLPDLHFFLWCQNRYKLNKGVYNTIDNWFYTYGVISIINRRIFIIAFLESVTKGNPELDQHKYIRFGNGGLSSKLQQFMEETEKYDDIM